MIVEQEYSLVESFHAMAETITLEKPLSYGDSSLNSTNKQNERYVSQYQRFRILGKNIYEEIYFVGRIEPFAIEPNDFYWCKANQILKVGDVVKGSLNSPEDTEDIAMLIVEYID
jgi:hypothetical protein